MSRNMRGFTCTRDQMTLCFVHVDLWSNSMRIVYLPGTLKTKSTYVSLWMSIRVSEMCKDPELALRGPIEIVHFCSIRRWHLRYALVFAVFLASFSYLWSHNFLTIDLLYSFHPSIIMLYLSFPYILIFRSLYIQIRCPLFLYGLCSKMAPLKATVCGKENVS